MPGGKINMQMSIQDLNSLAVLKGLESELAKIAATMDTAAKKGAGIGATLLEGASAAGKMGMQVLGIGTGMAALYGTAQLVTRELQKQQEYQQRASGAVVDYGAATNYLKQQIGPESWSKYGKLIEKAAPTIGGKLGPDAGMKIATEAISSAGDIPIDTTVAIAEEVGRQFALVSTAEEKGLITQGILERIKRFKPGEKWSVQDEVGKFAASLQYYRSPDIGNVAKYGAPAFRMMVENFGLTENQADATLAAISQSAGDARTRLSKTAAINLLTGVQEAAVHHPFLKFDDAFVKRYEGMSGQEKLQYLRGASPEGWSENAIALAAHFYGEAHPDQRVREFARNMGWAGTLSPEKPTQTAQVGLLAPLGMESPIQRQAAAMEKDLASRRTPEAMAAQRRMAMGQEGATAQESAAHYQAKLEQEQKSQEAKQLDAAFGDFRQKKLEGLQQLEQRNSIASWVESAYEGIHYYGANRKGQAHGLAASIHRAAKRLIGSPRFSDPGFKAWLRAKGADKNSMGYTSDDWLRLWSEYQVSGGGLSPEDVEKAESYGRMLKETETFAEESYSPHWATNLPSRKAARASRQPANPSAAALENAAAAMQAVAFGLGNPLFGQAIGIYIDDAGGRARRMGTDQELPVQELGR